MYMFGLFAKPKRKRSSSGGHGGGKMLDTALAIAVLGGIGIVGYHVLKSGKGVEEGLQTGGDWLKKIVDAINSTGEAIGSGSKSLQDKSYEGQKNVGGWFEHSSQADERIVKGLQDAAGGLSETIRGLGCGKIRKC